RLLLDETLGDGAMLAAGVRTGVGDVGDEGAQLAVARLEPGDLAAGEEAIAQVAISPLDLALRLRPAHAAQPRLHVHLAGELDERGVKTDRAAAAFQHYGLRVVEEPLAWAASERRGRAHQRPTQRRGGQVEDELREHRARPRQHH